MSQVIIVASYCGVIQNQNTNYYNGRDATSGYDIANKTCVVGQWYFPVNYYFHRSFVFFDTSGITANAIITTATISFTTQLSIDNSDVNFNIIVRGASSASNPLVLDDYDLTHYNGENLGELTDNTPTTEENYRSFTLNINGCLYINGGGITKFVLLSEEDINNSPPGGDEVVHYSVSGSDYSNVKLTVTYFEPTELPKVTTTDNSCKDRQSTTLTATGNITSSGDGYTFRGFEYYEKGANLEYDSSMWAVREIGAFHILGEFEMTLNGLKPLTVYYIRAFAGNVFGISYGEWVECSTTEVPSYDIYEVANTATYKLYVSDDEAIAWRGYLGPYTAKQQNINITKITNLTKGIKVLKIVPTSKGTFHICVTVKEELKS